MYLNITKTSKSNYVAQKSPSLINEKQYQALGLNQFEMFCTDTDYFLL